MVGSSRCIDLAFQQDADGHFENSLYAGFLIPMDLVQPDIVLAVASSRKIGRHCLWIGLFG